MHHLASEYWVLPAAGVFLLIIFYACLWMAGRESDQERRFEARWDLEHEAPDASDNQPESAYPMKANFHARPTF